MVSECGKKTLCITVYLHQCKPLKNKEMNDNTVKAHQSSSTRFISILYNNQLAKVMYYLTILCGML